MFTMKMVDSHGVEHLEGDFHRTFTERDSAGRLLVHGQRDDDTDFVFSRAI